MQTCIETERLLLSPFACSDVDEVHAHWTHPDVRRFMFDDQIISLDQTRTFQRRSEAGFDADEFGLFVARIAATRAFAGVTEYLPFHEPPVAELLWSLESGHGGNGYATEMARAMLEWGCSVHGMTTIQASLDAPNVASSRVAERIGMKRMKRPATANDDLLYFSIDRGRVGSES
jgi:ribosomal-protein-alanine N-acetyltransferase